MITVVLQDAITGKSRVSKVTWEDLTKIKKQHENYINQLNLKKNNFMGKIMKNSTQKNPSSSKSRKVRSTAFSKGGQNNRLHNPSVDSLRRSVWDIEFQDLETVQNELKDKLINTVKEDYKVRGSNFSSASSVKAYFEYMTQFDPCSLLPIQKLSLCPILKQDRESVLAWIRGGFQKVPQCGTCSYKNNLDESLINIVIKKNEK